MKNKRKKKKDRFVNHFAFLPKAIGENTVWFGWWHESQFQILIGDTFYWYVSSENVGKM